MIHTAYIAFGSNLGDKKQHINDALKIIDEHAEIHLTKKSSIIETEPWGYKNQDHFLNGAIEIQTSLSAEELMKTLLEIESKLGRIRDIKNGPRTIDLDIIFFDDQISDDEFITLPHPRMHEREFVLKPLVELNPDIVHPVFKKTITELLKNI